MKRIDNSTATVDNLFTEGNPVSGQAATIMAAQWLNVLQEEIANVIESAGITLDQTGADDTQLLQAIPLLAPQIPVGATFFFPVSTPPSGFLEMDGAAISRTTYEDLFTLIGTTYGAGDGSTTFNLPDTRGEFIRGWDNGRGVDAARAIGSAQADELKAHDHVLQNGYSGSTNFVTTHMQRAMTGAITGADDEAIQDTGGVETRPRNIAMMGIIKY